MRSLHVAKIKLMDAVAAGRHTDVMDDADKRDTIEKVTARIVARHPDAPTALVAKVVAEEYDLLASSRIRTYIPTLVEQRVRNRLKSEFATRTLEEI